MPVEAGTAIIQGKIQADAAKDAAGIQAQAGAEANRLQKEMYDQNRADNEPWRQAGMKALGGMQDGDFQRDFNMGDFQADPGYQFRMAEGQKALERSAAARGGLQSGGTMKALAKYSQDVASSEYSNVYNRFNADRDRRFNRLGSLAGVGQTANAQVGAAGANYANQSGANTIGTGNAVAGGRLAVGQAWSGAAAGVGKAYANERAMALEGASMAGGMMMSDERAKKNITPADDDIKELLDVIEAHSYEYKDAKYGAGVYASPMAQELEKTKLGKGLVVDTFNGKMVDYGRGLGTIMATQAFLYRKLKALEPKGEV